MDQNTKQLAEDLKAMMQIGTVTFVFKKIDGTERIAKGTTKQELIPEAQRPKPTIPVVEGAEIPYNPVQNYFDTEKQAWRSFQKDKLVKIG